ncbi:branched-chain amino acid aminotransferase/4-amino-4-deoxychorismate lyase [Microbacterium testaceum StLB037]|uniref:Branched-chain amino acid aminotransferase/4-amino-4-deoxychorismate lyase n=1 Tax=Microbacterium testaceum (strain StLB037) TaxID=979556 RepID=E8N8L9_MICTS|nr:aminodeoxychorismate lyase [Microbacterium testaceum]BAJ75675.1 branched-chain amino acid aminotransferase/4-amino-4-deoxychorismate lyase [Microbacterium testaceum StLB037]
MALLFALVIDPVASDDRRETYSATFTAVDPDGPVLPLGELSAQRGDGVFESIGVVDGHPQEVGPHLERLAHSARLVDLPAPNPEQWREAIARVAAEAGEEELVIKLILSRGVEQGSSPTAWITLATAPDNVVARTDGVGVVTLDRGYQLDVPGRAPWLLLGAKTLSYAVNMAAIREAKRRGADDAVFVTSDGYVLEAPTASVILRFGDRFVTPEPNAGILHGTTQLSLFAYLDRRGFATAYEAVLLSDLRTADAAWLLSSVRLAAPISAVDGVEKAVDRALTDELNAYLLSPRN